MKIILFSPEIPQNVGNIARTCAVTGAKLILVRPLGFSLSDRKVKRAGLDYWNDVDIETTDSVEEHLIKPFYFFSTHGKKQYTECAFAPDSTLIFGSETAGLPQWIHEKWFDHFYTIPMLPKARSLNLANSVAIVLYEALRQNQFTGLQKPYSEEHPNP